MGRPGTWVCPFDNSGQGRVCRLGEYKRVETPLLENSAPGHDPEEVGDELEETGLAPLTLSGSGSRVTVLSRGGTGPQSGL